LFLEIKPNKMPLLVESTAQTVTANDTMRDIILTALSFLSALSFREFLIAATSAASPPGTKENLVFIGFIAVTVLLLTLVIAIVWT
jgi:hypothetical protein